MCPLSGRSLVRRRRFSWSPGSVLLAVAPQARAIRQLPGEQPPGDASGQECRHADPPYRRLISGPRGVKLVEPRLKEAALVNGGDETRHFEIEQSQRSGPLRIKQEPPSEGDRHDGETGIRQPVAPARRS